MALNGSIKARSFDLQQKPSGAPQPVQVGIGRALAEATHLSNKYRRCLKTFFIKHFFIFKDFGYF
jgi:hypothetical protein